MKKTNLIKILYFMFFMLSIFVSGQKKYVFIPGFETGKEYFIEINNNSVIKDSNEKEYHKSNIRKEVRLQLLQQVNDYVLYSWKIKQYDKGQSKCDCIESFVENLDFIFKTDKSGNYLGFANSENLKLQIRSVLTDEFIKTFAKTRKDKTDTKEHLLSLKSNPEVFLRDIEKDIQKYFRFFNVRFVLGSSNYLGLYRSNWLDDKMRMPYTASSKFEIKRDGYYLSFSNVLDKKNAKDEDWRTICNKEDNYCEKFKNNFTSDIFEQYVFSKVSGQLKEIKISIMENILSHTNGIRTEDFTLKLLE